VRIRVTSAVAHPKLLAGAHVIIEGTTSYNGYYVVCTVAGDDSWYEVAKAFVADETGTWRTRTETMWDSGSGNQIEWEVWSKEFTGLLTESLRINAYFVMKQMVHLFCHMHPLTVNELVISVWDRSMNYLAGGLPIFTQAGGWGIDKFGTAKWDTLLSERWRWDCPGNVEGSAFQIRFKYPRNAAEPDQKIFGSRPKIKYLAFSYFNKGLIESTTQREV